MFSFSPDPLHLEIRDLESLQAMFSLLNFQQDNRDVGSSWTKDKWIELYDASCANAVAVQNSQSAILIHSRDMTALVSYLPLLSNLNAFTLHLCETVGSFPYFQFVNKFIPACASHSSKRHLSCSLLGLQAGRSAGLNIQSFAIRGLGPISSVLFNPPREYRFLELTGAYPYAREFESESVLEDSYSTALAPAQNLDLAYTTDKYHHYEFSALRQVGYRIVLHGVSQSLRSLTISFPTPSAFKRDESVLDKVYIPHLHTLRLIQLRLQIYTFETFMLAHAKTLRIFGIGEALIFAEPELHPFPNLYGFDSFAMPFLKHVERTDVKVLSAFERVGRELRLEEVKVEGQMKEELERLLRRDDPSQEANLTM
jgi:hypothetical protein